VDAGHDERGGEVRARVLTTAEPARLRVVSQAFADDPVLDVAVSRALMQRVAAGELPETLRLTRPGAMVAFAKQDAVAPGYAAAVRAARASGFEAVLRLAGGRAAVFHRGTVALAHAVPDPEPRAGIHSRFEWTATLIASALRRLGVDARVGQVPGEYCPGGYSVNARGAVKLAGIGQRIIAGGSHLGGVIVVGGGARVRDVLVPVYRALELAWDPDTTGAVEEERDGAPSASWTTVRDALLAEYALEYKLVEAGLDAETLALARRLAPEHRPA
jgi:octanoyl-[GcvH]:protein N-octanoyltransferase